MMQFDNSTLDPATGQPYRSGFQSGSHTAPVDMTMQPEEFASLRAEVAGIKERDFHLGRVLEMMTLHLGHAHDLDPVVEDARLTAKAKADARTAEDARIKAEAGVRATLRTAEDAQPRTPAETDTLAARRAAEDMQVTADAEALTKAREEEDAKQKAADEQAAKDASAEG
jgi:hypothetical protein